MTQTQATPSGPYRSEGEERRLDAPFLSVDVPFELARLRAEALYEVEGHAGRTIAKYPDMRVVLEAMKPGRRLPFHETAERMTLQVIVGQLRVWLPRDENVELSEGSFSAVDAAQIHELESLDECAFLLTLAWPPAAALRRESSGSGI